MATVSGPAKGKTQELHLSAQGRPRLLVGLSWVPKDEGPRIRAGIPPLKDAEGLYDTFYFFKLPFFLLRALVLGLVTLFRRHVKIKSDPHDLDLCCYITDRDYKVLETVGPKEGSLIEPGRKVYHSGEDQTGRNPADAEQIFIEMRGLPAEYDQFFFAVKSANRNTLGDIPDGTIRLVDSGTNEILLQNSIAASALPPGNSFGCVFCSVFRKGEGWAFRNIDSFTGREVDWPLLVRALELQQGLA